MSSPKVALFLLVYPALFLLLILGFFFLAWGLLMGSWYISLYAGFFITLLIAPENRLLGTKKKRLAIALVALLLIIPTAHLPISEINSRLETLDQRYQQHRSIGAFNLREKASLYMLNLMMGLVALPLYPEASLETLALALPEPERGERYFSSDFLMGSEQFRTQLQRFNRQLQGISQSTAQHTFWLRWRGADYALGSREARYALALNPSRVTLYASREASRWRISAQARVRIAYAENYVATLIHTPELKVQEGLIWMLGQAGILHPYSAVWQFTIWSDDPRLEVR